MSSGRKSWSPPCLSGSDDKLLNPVCTKGYWAPMCVTVKEYFPNIFTVTLTHLIFFSEFVLSFKTMLLKFVQQIWSQSKFNLLLEFAARVGWAGIRKKQMFLPQSKEQIFLLYYSIGLRKRTYLPLTIPSPNPTVILTCTL